MEPSPASTAPYLKRVLGLRDLVLLGIVAVFKPNLVPPAASSVVIALSFAGKDVWLHEACI